MPASDAPDRLPLIDELHSRPLPQIAAPGQVAFLALVPDGPRQPEAERAHVMALLDAHGAPHPAPGASHHSVRLGSHVLKWENHTEFVTYMLMTEGPADPFGPEPFACAPEGWLDSAPGRRMVAVRLHIERAETDDGLAERAAHWLPAGSLAMARVQEGAAVVAGNFRLDAQGWMRFAIFARPQTGAGRIGRIAQRLCEIETYRAMSMLGLATSRRLSPDLQRLGGALSTLAGDIETGGTDPKEALNQLLGISSELERLEAASAYRFGATQAYQAIVHDRIEALQETRLDGRQSFAEFMARRYAPAMRTVTSTRSRLDALTARAGRAGTLLRTRVEVAHSAQSQALLESMDRRADLQLRLQQTVEGVSVVAISYYALNLVSYALAPLAKLAGIDKPTLTALCVLPVVAAVWLMIARIKRAVH